jgi:hypothetical protein
MPLGHFFDGAFGTSCLFCTSFLGAFTGYLVGIVATTFCISRFRIVLGVVGGFGRMTFDKVLYCTL